MPGSTLTECRVCGGRRFESAIDLGTQPWCNHFLRPGEVGTEATYPLHVVFCDDCHTVQLNHTVPKEVMFGDHTYLSGMTKSLSEHFRQVAQEIDTLFFAGVSGKSVLDIGSNDGTQLKHFRELGWDVLGVESSKTTAQIAVKAGIPTVNQFFNLQTAQAIGRKFHVINAAGVFFHLEELHSVTDAIRESLRDDGVFVVQFLYMKRIVENHAFDQIYHEHLLYYNLQTIQALLSRHGLEMFDATLSPIHGGSIIGYVTHKGKRAATDRLQAMRKAEDTAKANELATYRAFAETIKKMKQENLAFLNDAAKAGKRVFGMGAPVKGNTLLNYFGIGPNLIQCLVEKNELRRGLYSPGMHIPIVMESELPHEPEVYYVLAWNFKKEILARQQHLVQRGVQFYFPVDPRDP